MSMTFYLTEREMTPNEVCIELYSTLMRHLRANEKTLSKNYKHMEPDGCEISLRYRQDEPHQLKVEYHEDRPCGRGCCSDYIHETLIFPDTLVEAFEEMKRTQYANDDLDEQEHADAQFAFALSAYVETLRSVKEAA